MPARTPSRSISAWKRHAELGAAGYITRRRIGRRNHYTINAHLPLPDPIAGGHNLGALLGILTGSPAAEEDGQRSAETR